MATKLKTSKRDGGRGSQAQEGGDVKRTIQIPHINYTVKVRPMKPHPDGQGAKAWTHHVDRHNTILYLPDRPTPGLVAHEVTHILQHICEVRFIDFVRETEHMGYLSQYLVGCILGYEWSRS